jgi:hypothetical protein
MLGCCDSPVHRPELSETLVTVVLESLWVDPTAHPCADSSCLQHCPARVPMELGISIFNTWKSGESTCHCQSHLRFAQPVRILDPHCNRQVHAGALLRRGSRTGYDPIVHGRFRWADALENARRFNLSEHQFDVLCRKSSIHSKLISQFFRHCGACFASHLLVRPFSMETVTSASIGQLLFLSFVHQ